MNREEAECQRKEAHGSEATARQGRFMHGERTGGQPYRCKVCGYWHVGRARQRNRKRRRF